MIWSQIPRKAQAMNSTKLLALLALSSAAVSAQTGSLKPGPKVDPAASRKEIRVVARNLAAEVRAPLTPVELDVARLVYVGTLPCELGQVVVLTPEPENPGYFFLKLGQAGYRVSPEATTTGAIRLEDKAAGIVWLQLANKSMLMSQKLGRRLADDCLSPIQAQFAKAMLTNPPVSVLDPVPAPADPKVVVD